MNTQYKQMTRSTTNRMIAGVCAGLGEYLHIDPTVVRLLFLLALFLTGPGILVAYLSNYLLRDLGENSWRWMLGVVAFPSFLFILLVTLVPRSPRWLIVKRGDESVVYTSVLKLIGEVLSTKPGATAALFTPCWVSRTRKPCSPTRLSARAGNVS